MSFSTVRAAIVDALSNVEGLSDRVTGFYPGAPNPPCAVVGFPDEFDPHAAYGDETDYTIPVELFTPYKTNRAAEEALEAFLATSGPQSLIAAIESIGSGYTVVSVRNIGPVTIGDPGVRHLTATLAVRVLA